MSRLLALSFDCPTTPYLTLGKIVDTTHDAALQGWGIAWYPDEDFAAAVIKDSQTKSRALVTQVFSHWKHFNSTIMVCNLRGASKHTSQQDTQPFIRAFAGRDWILTHNGDLENNYRQVLKLANQPIFEPLGITDSEYLFCWLLEQINHHNARSLADIDYETILGWLHFINQLGTLNLILSDGTDLIIYQDKNLFNPLYWTRKHPPHHQKVFQSPTTRFEINDNTIHRTFILATTYNSFSNECSELKKSQMLVARRGNIIWNTHDSPNYFYLNNRKKSSSAPFNSFDLKKTDIKIQTDSLKNQFNKENFKKNSLHIMHTTTYRYNKPIELSKHYLRLFPVQDLYQEIIHYHLHISAENENETFEDVFGNRVCYVCIDKPYDELIIKVDAIVSINDLPYNQESHLHARQQIPLAWMPWQSQMMLPYLLPPELPESQLTELVDFAMSFAKRNDYDVFSLLCDMNSTIYNDFSYVSGSTSIETTPYEVYTERQGVCQDFANLFICLARLLNIPARYRAGYIYTGSNYENKIQSEASHAWAEVYLPWLGWHGFDPTNGCVASKDHIRVACGRNYFDATPTSGTIYKGGGYEELTVNVKVELENKDLK